MVFAITPFSMRDELQPLLDAWASAFAAPPNGPRHEIELRDQLQRHSALPNFCGLIARSTETGAILGLTYGYSNAPGQWWRDRVAVALGPRHAGPVLHNTFCLTELGVVPAGRRQGIAEALVRELLARQPHPRALLSTRSDNTEGLAFYRVTGWRIIVPHMSFGWGFPPYDILECSLPMTVNHVT